MDTISVGGFKIKGWQLGLGAAVAAFFVFGRKAQAAGVIGITMQGVATRAEWAERLYFAILNAKLPPLSDASKRMILAHAALETGYPPYRRDSAANCNNIFNITTGTQWLKDGKPFCTGGDVTYSNPLPDGRPRPITQKWRAYLNLEEALENYWYFLGSRPSLLRAREALLAGDPAAFAARLREAGYYDAPLDRYVAGVSSGMRYVQKLLPILT